MRRTPLVPAFAAWSVLIWGTRIRNIWQDDELSTAGRLGSTALALSFVAGGAALALAWWRGTPEVVTRATAALALWTGAVWAVRATGILLGDWGVGFKVVHTVLAGASIALGAAAFRQAARDRSAAAGEQRRPATGGHPDRRERPSVPG